MEKPKKKKKSLNVDIDTAKVDVKVNRNEEGDVKATLDTEKVDITYTKTEDKTTVAIKLEDGKEYYFESNGKSRKLPAGIWKVTGELARLFLAQGFGKLKNK